MLGLSGWGRASILLLVAALVLAVGSSYSMASPTEQTATLGGGIPPTVFALTAVAQRADPAAAGRDEPWPPFTMTFQETTHEHLGSATTRTQRVRVGYTVRRQFTTTLLADSAVPQSVGMMPTFNGQTTVHHRPGFPDVVTQWAPGELTVPAKWLAPGGIDGLLKMRGYTSRPLGTDLAVASREETVPAYIPPSGAQGPAATPQPARQVRTEITYRVADGIPTRLVETVNGVEAHRIEVQDLQVRSR